MKPYGVEASNSAKAIVWWSVLLAFWRELLWIFLPFSLGFIYVRPFSIDENILGDLIFLIVEFLTLTSIT